MCQLPVMRRIELREAVLSDKRRQTTGLRLLQQRQQASPNPNPLALALALTLTLTLTLSL